MNCNEFIDKIIGNDRLELTITEPETAAHLEQCPGCRSRLAFERQIRGEFITMVEQTPPDELWAKVADIPQEDWQSSRAQGEAEASGSTSAADIDLQKQTVPTFQKDASHTENSSGLKWLQSRWLKLGLSFAILILLVLGINNLSRYKRGNENAAVKTDAGSSSYENHSLYVSETKVPPIQITEEPEKNVASAESATVTASEQQMFVAVAPEEISAAPTKSRGDFVPIACAPQPQVKKSTIKEAKVSEKPSLPPANKSTSARKAKFPSEEQEEEPFEQQLDDSETFESFQKDENAQIALQPTSQPEASTTGLTVGAATFNTETSIPMPQSKLGETQSSSNIPSNTISRKSSKRKFVVLPVPIDKRQKIEKIMAAHASEIRPGTLDIDQWLLMGWITVKEHIDIAPPPGTKWVAVKRAFAWKAELIQLP